jgi:cyclopropane-fatty-acyl-phospholipid synthase
MQHSLPAFALKADNRESLGIVMGLFTLEHGKRAYHADLLLYGAAVIGLALFMLGAVPHAHLLGMTALVTAGLGAWTLIEYLMHRFILHGLRPFSRWHAEHHARPMALICTPTLISATLLTLLVFVPAFVIGNVWQACALTFGVLSGYFAYTLTHHATHHWRAGSSWLKQRKRWHALHHHLGRPGCYGVTSGFWDRVFGSCKQQVAGQN